MFQAEFDTYWFKRAVANAHNPCIGSCPNPSLWRSFIFLAVIVLRTDFFSFYIFFSPQPFREGGFLNPETLQPGVFPYVGLFCSYEGILEREGEIFKCLVTCGIGQVSKMKIMVGSCDRNGLPTTMTHLLWLVWKRSTEMSLWPLQHECFPPCSSPHPWIFVCIEI